MKEKLENLLERMNRAKRTTTLALLSPLDDIEKQNVIWIDTRLGLWIHDLKKILLVDEVR